VPSDHNLRGADKNHLQWRGSQAGLAFADGTVNLTAVSVALYADIQRAQGHLRRILNFFGQKNGPGACAECGLGAHEVTQLLEEAVFLKKVQERGGFAAGNDDSVDRIQLLRLAHQRDFPAQLLQSSFVRFVVTLDGKNADVHEE